MRFHTNHGVFAEEKKLGQQLAVDVFVEYDIEHKVKDDDLNTTINYASVFDDVKNYVENERFNLIESLANGLLDLLANKYSTADGITINIRKGSVPIDGIFDDVQITVSNKK